MKKLLLLSVLLIPAAAKADGDILFQSQVPMIRVTPAGKVEWLVPKDQAAKAMLQLIAELQGRLAACQAPAQAPAAPAAPQPKAAPKAEVEAPAKKKAVVLPTLGGTAVEQKP